MTRNICVCIPTYRRPQLLTRLILDLMQQKDQVNTLVVVDGDPVSGEVPTALTAMTYPEGWAVKYLPSNRGNLSYQRYLGWKAAKHAETQAILYLDDDLRILQSDAIAKVLAPFGWQGRKIGGVTASISQGDISKFVGTEALSDRTAKASKLASWFGSARNLPPGGISPLGTRRLPDNPEQDYAKVDFMFGRVMAYDLNILTQECFSDDMFALDHIRCGLGEDTFLARRVAAKSELIMAQCAHFEHPDDDVPQSYPYQARKFAYATAYSRRLLNNYYRGFAPPRLSDRFELIKNYIGHTFVVWIRALLSRRRYKLAYAYGYMLGAARGMLQDPTAKNLTPNIDWWAEADVAMSNLRVIKLAQRQCLDE